MSLIKCFKKILISAYYYERLRRLCHMESILGVFKSAKLKQSLCIPKEGPEGMEWATSLNNLFSSN